MKQSVLNEMLSARRARHAVVRAVELETGRDMLLDLSDKTSPLAAAAMKAARDDRSQSIEIDGRRWFLSVHNPPLDLVIVGAVHIAQFLIQIAHMAGYGIRVVDPRTGFATIERFPGVLISHDWPDDALAAEPMGRRSALVALTHDPKVDDPALVHALRSDCFYIGALGSKKTHAGRLERMRRHGFAEAELARIHGPIGLAIGARSPAEIAISIMAEITLRLRAGDAWEQSVPRTSA